MATQTGGQNLAINTGSNPINPLIIEYFNALGTLTELATLAPGVSAYQGSEGQALVTVGTGFDGTTFKAGSIPNYGDVEIVIGTGQNTTVIGNGFSNRFFITDDASHEVILKGGNDVVMNAGSGGGTFKGGGGQDTLIGGSGSEDLRGGSGNDRLLGGGGDDKLLGGGGDDQLYGGEGNDFLEGGSGNDLLVGGEGDDYLSSGMGNDQLYGGAGDDALSGGTGSDILAGGEGNDQLTGGQGADVFVFGSEATGQDVIMDFSAKDQLNIADRLAYEDGFYTMAQVGNDTVITFDNGDTITLRNIKADHLLDDDEDGIFILTP